MEKDEIIDRALRIIKQRAAALKIELTQFGEASTYYTLLGILDRGGSPEEAESYARAIQFTEAPRGIRTVALWRNTTC